MASKLRGIVAEARWRGLWGTVRAMKMNKLGTMHCFIGSDLHGNRFFEDPTETYGRDRWVEYVDDRNPDSVKITPEWHAWLHHNTDIAPTEQPLPKPVYEAKSRGNTTGTKDAYFPADHKLAGGAGAGEKVEVWAGTKGTSDNMEESRLDLK